MPFTPYKLRIEFGGLCMLVQRDTGSPQGLFALMPTMNAPNMVHTPMLLACDKRYVSSGSRPKPVHLQNRVLKWGSLANAGTKQPMHKHVPSFAKFGGKPLGTQWLTHDPAQDQSAGRVGCLAARVELPLGSTISAKPGAQIGEVVVNYEGQPRFEKVVGEAIVEVNVTNPSAATIDVGPDESGNAVVLKPCCDLLEIKIISIIREDLNVDDCTANTHKVVHKGDKIEHVQAYYQLLENGCGAGPSGPVVVVAEEPPADEALRYILASRFINPYQCTLGTG